MKRVSIFLFIFIFTVLIISVVSATSPPPAAPTCKVTGKVISAIPTGSGSNYEYNVRVKIRSSSYLSGESSKPTCAKLYKPNAVKLFYFTKSSNPPKKSDMISFSSRGFVNAFSSFTYLE